MENHDHPEEGAAHKNPEAADHVELTAGRQKLAGIEVAAVTSRQVQGSLEVPGIVEATSKGRAVVTPPIAGRLVSISIQPGDRVRKGQVLAVLESSELAQAWASIADAKRMRDAAAAGVHEAKSQIALAESKVRTARQSLDRQKQFAAAGAFGESAVQQAQSELNDAQSELLGFQKEQATHADQLRRLEILFAEGVVSRNELDSARLELQQDEIKLSRALTRVEIAKNAYDRERSIASKGLQNAREIQTAESEVRAAGLERDRADVLLRSAEAALTNATTAVTNAQATYTTYSGGGKASGGRVSILAPIDGTIAHLDVTRGQGVDRTQAVAEIENLDAVWVTASVPEAQIGNVRAGGQVRITVAAHPDQTFEGLVQVIGSRIDAKTRALPVQCLVANNRGRLKPEMFAKVFLGEGQKASSLVVPESALVRDGTETFVFVKEGERFERREVSLGSTDGQWISVRTGLQEGDKVVVKGTFVLVSELKRGELKGHEH